MVTPTSSPAGSEGAAALVVALAAAVGGALGWGGARLCDSLVMAALTGDAPLPPAATRLLSLAWSCLERLSADANRLPEGPLRARVQRGLERVTLLTPRGAALAAERLAARPDGADPSAFGALPGSLAPTPREGEEAGEGGEVSYVPSHDSRPSPSRKRLLEDGAGGGAGAAAAAPAAAAADAAASSPPAPRRPSSAARFKALFTPPKGAKAAAAPAPAPAAGAAAAAAPADASAVAPAAVAAPSSSAPKRPSSAQRLKAAFSPKQQKTNAIEVSASAASVVAVPPLLSSHALAASPAAAAAAAEKPKQRPSSAQRLKAAFSPKRAAGGSVAESPSKRPSSAARLRAALKIGGSTPSKGSGSGAAAIGVVASSPARPAYVPGSIAAALASPSQSKRFEF